jgi:acyl carrier protein
MGAIYGAVTGMMAKRVRGPGNAMRRFSKPKALRERWMPSDSEVIFKEISELLQVYNPDGVELTPDMDMTAELAMDSVAAMDLVMEIENKFDIDIPISLLSEVRCPQDLVDLVQRQQQRA